MKIRYFIISSLLILVSYVMFIHPFEVPDENAHYSSLTFLYNEGRMPNVKDSNNLSLEELETEKIFGIVEHQNKYSYHPEFRMGYSNSTVGIFENEVKSFNTQLNRTTYDTFQAAIYPPLYYWLTLPFYSLVSKSDILLRLVVSRMSSVIITVLLVWVAYLIGDLVFSSKKYGLTVAVMTLFFPMTTYIGAGVNSDNLHNLLFGVATLLALKLIKDGFSRNLSLLIGTFIGLDLITKPQGYILIPIFALAVIIRWRWDEWRAMLSSIFYILVPLFLIAGWQEIPKFMSGNPYVSQTIMYGGWDQFEAFTQAYIHTHISEMPVWYWGVFKWFGVVLPKPLWWIGTRLIGLAFIGLLTSFYHDIKNHVFSLDSRIILFSIGGNIVYVAALYWFDWQFYRQFGRSLGLQARYYMPLLVSQMYLFLLGLTNLGWNQKVKEWIRIAVIVFFLGLQLASFYVQLNSYYDLSSPSILITQISQYKPWFAKGTWWYLWFPLYFVGIITTATKAIRARE